MIAVTFNYSLFDYLIILTIPLYDCAKGGGGELFKGVCLNELTSITVVFLLLPNRWLHFLSRLENLVLIDF